MLKRPKYLISLATKYDIDHIYDLCHTRVKWFRENNIDQWHVLEKSDLKKILAEELNRKDLYKITCNKKIVGSFVLSPTDSKRWEFSDDTYYLWRLVTDPKVKGLGKRIIRFCCKKCKDNHKKFLRGYYVASNEKLKQIYSKYGFTVVSTYETKTGKLLDMIEIKIK